MERYRRVNEHHATIPRNFWFEEWEREGIVGFCIDHPREGHLRLPFVMLDRDIVGLSPASAWRVLSKAGLPNRCNRKPGKKDAGCLTEATA